jgi:hypothetical protein
LPFNLPSTTVGDISFGPAVVYLGASGSTPSVDVGAITEDGVTIEVTSEKRDIMQGNPRTIEYSFAQAQGVRVSWTGIEWDWSRFQYAIGAGNTLASASLETWSLGGDPIVETVAVRVQHYMAQAAQTLDFRIWKARGDGPVSMPMGQDEHQFPYAFLAMRSATNWAGVTLARDEQLLQIVRMLT